MSLRPAFVPEIQVSDIKPGDVILSASSTKGRSKAALISKLIRTMDQGDYTHSSLLVDKDTVIEALLGGQGVAENPLQKTLDFQVLVDVYRYRKEGQQLNDAIPLIEAARNLSGQQYSYSTAVLAGLLLLTREVPLPPIVKLILQVGKLITDAIDELSSKHTVICSEIVAQAFWDAKTQPEHKLGLPINLEGYRKFPPPIDYLRELDAAVVANQSYEMQQLLLLRATAAHRFAGTNKLVNRLPIQLPKYDVIAGSLDLPAEFVTPGDLQRSSALELVGTLKS